MYSTAPSGSPSPSPAAGSSRLRELISRYGKVALGTHVGLGLCSLAACYSAVKYGVDIHWLTEKLGLDVAKSLSESKYGAEAGTFAIAYVIHKALAPVRIPITIAVTPFIATKLKKKPATDPGTTSS